MPFFCPVTYDTGYVPIDRKYCTLYKVHVQTSQASAATNWLEERYGRNFQVSGEISVA